MELAISDEVSDKRWSWRSSWKISCTEEKASFVIRNELERGPTGLSDTPSIARSSMDRIADAVMSNGR